MKKHILTQRLYFVAGRRTRRVACQAAFAGLQKLLGPTVVHAFGDAFAAAQLGDAGLAAQAIQHDADFLFRRIMLAGCSVDVPDQPL